MPLTGVEALQEYGDFSKYGKIAAILDIDLERCSKFNEGAGRTIDIKSIKGGHGGADPYLKHEIFVEQSQEAEELGLAANFAAGARAVGIGEAVWRSAEDNRPVNLSELLHPDLLK